jgi:hypothetical protein
MTPCKACNKETSNLFYSTESGAWLCSDCKPLAQPLIDFKQTVTLKGGVQIGAGHLADIKARRTAPDGSIYRDKGTKYFI